MSLKKSRGNMYPWVDFTHSHLAGECPHKCDYCYVGRGRFGRPERYKGPIRLIENEFNVRYPAGKKIFIEHMSDLFASEVPEEFIREILRHCLKYPDAQYVLQTKNPIRAWWLFSRQVIEFPIDFIMGTTIETNRFEMFKGKASDPPPPSTRAEGIYKFAMEGTPIFITIEPILDFDPDTLADWMKMIRPRFINIGADSKGCGLVEPPREKVEKFIALLNEAKILIRKKSNLGRLMHEEILA